MNQARYLQNMTDHSGRIEELQVAALAPQGYEQFNQRTDSRAIDLGDFGEIDEYIAWCFFGEFVKFRRERIVRVTDHNPSPDIEDRNVLGFSR
jgi:hypothetical protein